MIIGASLSKPTLVKQRPLRSIYDLSIVCHSVNKEPPHSNLLESFNFSKCQYIPWVPSHSNNRGFFNFTRAMGVHCTGCRWACACCFLTHDTTQLALLTLVIVHWVGQLQLLWAEQCVSKTSLVQCYNRQPILLLFMLLDSSITNLLSYQSNMQLVPMHVMSNHMYIHSSWRLTPQCPAFV